MPKFQPKPGQIDFTDARWAPVVNCVLKFQDKILVVKRSSELRLYPNLWNGISGFLDDQKTLEEKVKEEIKEEVGLGEKDIESIKLGEIHHNDDPQYGKTWIVHPVLVEVKTDKVQLDWEAQEYRWINIEEARNLELMPGFKQVLAILC